MAYKPLGFGVGVEGFDELQARLDGMRKNGADKAIRKALRAGARVVQAAIQERTPVAEQSHGDALPPGALAADINISNVKKTGDTHYEISVGPGKYTAHVARWVEYGHQNVTGGRHGEKAGFTPPHPFIRPATEESQAAAASAVTTTLTEELALGPQATKEVA